MNASPETRLLLATHLRAAEARQAELERMLRDRRPSAPRGRWRAAFDSLPRPTSVMSVRGALRSFGTRRLGRDTTWPRFGHVVGALLAGTLVIGLLAPDVAADNAGSTIRVAEPVDLVFPAGTCPDLPGDLELHLVGSFDGVFHLSTDALGVLHVHWTDRIHGTATDNHGGTYRFTYNQTGSVHDAGLPVSVRMTDHFNLVGSGGERIQSFFVQTLVVSEDGVDVLVTTEHGNPEQCDPL